MFASIFGDLTPLIYWYRLVFKTLACKTPITYAHSSKQFSDPSSHSHSIIVELFSDSVDEETSYGNRFNFLNQIPRAHLHVQRDFGYQLLQHLYLLRKDLWAIPI